MLKLLEKKNTALKMVRNYLEKTKMFKLLIKPKL